MNISLKRTLPAIMILALGSGGALAQESDSFEGATRDAWISGKVETTFLLNTHLNSFAIDTDVENGNVRLTGVVESDIDRELAGALAEGVDGVTSVENELAVDREEAARAAEEHEAALAEESEEREGRTFGTWVDDATTTAAVKSRLVANAETEGLEIDVDTHDDIVTLSGRVQSEEAKDLAQQIAMNTGDVNEVRNNLVVDPE